MKHIRLAAMAAVIGLFFASQANAAVTAEMVVQDQKSKIQLPVQVDEMTVLSDITAEENMVVYTMTVSVDIKELEAESAALAQQAKAMCNDPNYQTVLKQGMGIKIIYQDEQGGELPPLQVSPADCKM